MPQTMIFAPFLSMMLLTVLVWFYMYARRIPFLMKSKIDPNTITAVELARISPPAVANPSDNLKNLFELPTLFYALALYLYASQQVDGLYLAAAWAFVVFRVLHSAMHCTANIVLVRFWLYLVAALALWFMIIRAALGLLL